MCDSDPNGFFQWKESQAYLTDTDNSGSEFCHCNIVYTGTKTAPNLMRRRQRTEFKVLDSVG